MFLAGLGHTASAMPSPPPHLFLATSLRFAVRGGLEGPRGGQQAEMTAAGGQNSTR